MTAAGLKALDYTIVGIMLACSAAIGLYFRFSGGRQKTTREFLMADRNMGVLPVSFSLMATMVSAVTFLGSPIEAYYYGAETMTVELFFPIGIVIAAYCIVPVYFETGVSTIYEYLEKRFGKTAKMATSLLFTLQMILYMPVVVFAPALALSTVTGFSVWSATICMTVICTFYSSLGGLKAVLWTDVFQSLLMLLTLFMLIVKGSLDYGGFAEIFRTAKEGDRLLMFNTDLNPNVRYTLWNSLAQGVVSGTLLYGTTFTLIQRLMSCGSLKKAQSALMWAILLFFVFKISAATLGIVIYSYFHDCDPVQDKSNEITKGDQLVPHLILTLFGHLPGLPGLCVAGVLSAALSTMSSIVNSLVAVTVEDYLKAMPKFRELRDSTAALVAKCLAIFYGGLCILLAYLIANTKGIQEVTYVLVGMVGGPSLAVFCLGMFTTTANEQGSIIGLTIGFAFHAWMGFGSLYSGYRYKPLPLSTAGCESFSNISLQEMPRSMNSSLDFATSNFTDFSSTNLQEERYIFPLYKISYFWFMAISFSVTILSGYLASYIIVLWRGKEKVQLQYLSPVIRRRERFSPKPHANGQEYLEVPQEMKEIHKMDLKN